MRILSPCPLKNEDAQKKEPRDKLVARIDKLEEDINEASREIEFLKRETKQQLESMVKDIDNRWWLKPETAVGLAISALAVTLGTFYHLRAPRKIREVHNSLEGCEQRKVAVLL